MALVLPTEFAYARSVLKGIVDATRDRNQYASEFPIITSDDVGLGETAAQHFVERGFRIYAYFSAPWMIWSRERENRFHRKIS